MMTFRFCVWIWREHHKDTQHSCVPLLLHKEPIDAHCHGLFFVSANLICAKVRRGSDLSTSQIFVWCHLYHFVSLWFCSWSPRFLILFQQLSKEAEYDSWNAFRSHYMCFTCWKSNSSGVWLQIERTRHIGEYFRRPVSNVRISHHSWWQWHSLCVFVALPTIQQRSSQKP